MRYPQYYIAEVSSFLFLGSVYFAVNVKIVSRSILPVVCKISIYFRQNRLRSYFAVSGKIDTSLFLRMTFLDQDEDSTFCNKTGSGSRYKSSDFG